MKYLLALDQGTTSSRAILFDAAGQVLGIGQREFRQIFPRPGWVEHDANEIWQTQLEVAREALENAGVQAGQVAAIGITNQRETTVIWDRFSGEPIANAIVWQDRRTAALCDELRAGPEAERITERSGLQIDPYFSGTKIRWMLENVAGARERAEAGELAFGTIDSWLIWKLTGGREHLTDASNASRTMLYDIRRGIWDPDLLALLQVPQALLPRVVDSSGVCAETDPKLFGAAIPIGGIAGDQQAALFGQLCLEPGMVKNTYGTGCFLLMNTGEQPIAPGSGLLSTVAWRMNGATTYALEGAVFIGGAVVQWLRDGLGLIEQSSEIEALAGSVEDSQGVYFVPAFAGLGAPHWDAYARGIIVGLTRGTTGAHIARAALDGIAYQVADVVDAMRQQAGLDLSELRVDGGAAANDLLLQFQSDILGTAVVRPRNLETTALGAAYLAGLAVETWESTAELADRWQTDRRFEPSRTKAQASRLRAGWQRAVGRAKEWEVPDAP